MKVLLASLVLAVLRTGADEDLPRYVDVAVAVGIGAPNIFGTPPHRFLHETTGSGAAFFDYDGDGNLDLYVVNGRTREQGESDAAGPTDRLYRNLGDGRFLDVTELAGVREGGWGGGAAAADYDNDGDPDLLVTNYGRNTFYRNNGDGTLREVTEEASLGERGWSASAAFGDVDGDGFLDLYVARYVQVDFDRRLRESHVLPICRWKEVMVLCGPRGLPPEPDRLYRNQRDGTFLDVTESSGIDDREGYGLGVAFLDYDGDSDADIFVANDTTPNYLFENDGNGRFQDRALGAGAALSMYGKAQAGMGVDVADFDGDGRLDIVTTNFQGEYHALRHNLGSGMFVDASYESGLAAETLDEMGWGVKFLDANLDGFLDLFIVNGHIYPEGEESGLWSYGQRNQLLLNVPAPRGRKFEDRSADAGEDLKMAKSSRGLAVADYDDDFDLDIFINNINDVPTLLQDRAAHRNAAARLTLVGRKANRDAMGAVIAYESAGERHLRVSGALWSYLSTSDPRVLLGLGRASAGIAVSVRWPQSSESDPIEILAGEDVVVLEGAGRVR